MKKLINFKGTLNQDIQDMADKHCEGNFSLAVRWLIRRGLSSMPVQSKDGDSKDQLNLLNGD